MEKTILKHFSFSAFLLLPAIASLTFSGCGKSTVTTPDQDIVILATGDTHCKINKSLGFPQVASIKQQTLKNTPYVTLIDAGDSVQGELIGSVSKGISMTQIMNATGYDFAVIGNHEFDFGMKNFEEITRAANHKYLNANIKYTGTNQNFLDETIPYAIVEYGKTKVAYLGITTPLAVKSSTPSFFMEDNKYVYDFYQNKTGSKFFWQIQSTVDSARKNGADYVICITHLGISETNKIEKLFNADSLINHTKGIDAVIDSHEYCGNENRSVKNLKGTPVPILCSGNEFESICRLTINTEGIISSSRITEWNDKDEQVEHLMNSLQKDLKKQLGIVVAESNINLSINNEKGIRIVRTRETGIGNLCADTYRYLTHADIGLANGGGVRASLPKGEVTNEEIIAVNPFGNKICSRKVTGQQILDCLEFAAKNTMSETDKNGKACGEFGGFLQVSGLRFTIDTSIRSPVVVDEKGMLSDIRGYRRIKDVQVLKNGRYTAIDPNSLYTVGSLDYIIKNGGDGNTALLEGELLANDIMPVDQALIYYITSIMDGKLNSRYATTEHRITVM